MKRSTPPAHRWPDVGRKGRSLLFWAVLPAAKRYSLDGKKRTHDGFAGTGAAGVLALPDARLESEMKIIWCAGGFKAPIAEPASKPGSTACQERIATFLDQRCPVVSLL
jgi:hypothetical protein